MLLLLLSLYHACPGSNPGWDSRNGKCRSPKEARWLSWSSMVDAAGCCVLERTDVRSVWDDSSDSSCAPCADCSRFRWRCMMEVRVEVLSAAPSASYL
jgi:hypothetical protein